MTAAALVGAAFLPGVMVPTRGRKSVKSHWHFQVPWHLLHAHSVFSYNHSSSPREECGPGGWVRRAQPEGQTLSLGLPWRPAGGGGRWAGLTQSSAARVEDPGIGGMSTSPSRTRKGEGAWGLSTCLGSASGSRPVQVAQFCNNRPCLTLSG